MTKKDLLLLLDDIIAVAKEQEKLVHPESLKNKNGGSGFVVYHLNVLRDGLESLKEQS